MLATKNNTTYIGMFLKFIKTECLNYGLEWPVFKHMVTDYSRPILNAICDAFNNMTLIEYVNLIHKCINSNNNIQLKKVTEIHLCFSHLMKNISRVIKRHYKDNNSFIYNKLFGIIRFIFEELDIDVIRKMWILLNRLCNEKSDELARIIIIDIDIEMQMHSKTKRNDDNYENENVSDDSTDENLEQECTLYNQSAFYKEFFVSNTFFNPKFSNYLL